MSMRLLLALSFGLFVAVATVSPSRARAEEGKITSLLYNCSLGFKANGRSIYIGLGFTDIQGKGKISCFDFLTGATQHIPIKVTVRGPGAGLGVTGVEIAGGATGIGLTRGPESLLGRYVAVRGNAAVGIGVGAASALRVSKEAVTLDVSIHAQQGLGAGVDILWVEIEQDGERTIQPAVVQAPVARVAQPIPAQPVAAPVIQSSIAVPTQVLYVNENQPVRIVDSQGRTLKVIYLRRAQ